MSARWPDAYVVLGEIALEMRVINQNQLTEAVRFWEHDQRRGLGEILVERGFLSAELLGLLEMRVRRRLENAASPNDQTLPYEPQHQSLLGTLPPEDASPEDASLEDTATVDVPLGADSKAGGLLDTLAQDDADPATPTPTQRAPRRSADGMRYRPLQQHAQGGLGVVHRALDEELSRVVALKEIHNRLADQPVSRARFLLEAEITGNLEHPGIVPVYGLGTYPDGRPYYAMRFIRGITLEKAIHDYHQKAGAPEDKQREFRQLLGRLLTVCNTIEYAHSRGILHRDIKPANIMLGDYGETLVVDWGLAKAGIKRSEEPVEPAKDMPPPAADEEAEDKGPDTLRLPSCASSMTMVGSAVGTPAFMSPEQALGKLDDLGPASDVYSLGATLYALLTGRAPIDAQDVAVALVRAQRGEFPLPAQVRPGIAPALQAICLKAMARDPAQRYASARRLAEDVERWLAGDPVEAWPEPWTLRLRRWLGRHRTFMIAAAASVLVALVGLGAFSLVLGLANDNLKEANGREASARSLAQRREKDAQVERDNAVKQEGIAEKARQQAEREKKIAEYQKHQAEEARKLADAEKLEKERELRRSEWLVYAGKIALAQREWEGGNVREAHDQLAGCRPDFRAWEHAYLKTLFQDRQQTLPGHGRAVTCLAYSPDDRWLASGGQDDVIKIWDAAGKEVHTLRGHDRPIAALAFHPRDAILASAAGDRRVFIWDLETGQEKNIITELPHLITALAYAADGKTLFAGGEDGHLLIVDVESGQVTKDLEAHNGRVTCLAVSPDGKRLASGGEDDRAVLWDARTGQKLHTLKGHEHIVSSVAFSHDGARLATASWDHSARVWDTATGQDLLTLRGHAQWLSGVAFRADGQRLITAGHDRFLKVWNARTGQEMFSLRGHLEEVTCLAVSPKSVRVASGSGDRTIKIWDAATGQEPRTLTGHQGPLTSLAVSPNAQYMASSSWDRTIRLWIKGGKVEVLKGHSDRVLAVAFHPDSDRLASGGLDHTIKIWETPTGTDLATLKGHTSAVTSLAFLADGVRLASGSYDQTIKIWNVKEGKDERTLKGHQAAITCLAAVKGDVIVSGSLDRTVRVWDAASGVCKKIIKGHDDGVTCLALHPKGEILATGSADKLVRLWDLSTGQLLLTLRGHADALTGVAFHPDGRRLASAGGDRKVRVWDTSSGQETLVLRGHTSEVVAVAFGPTGRYLVSASADRTIRMWDAHAGEP